MLKEITKRIDELFNVQERVVVGIDGDCAAGKTALAAHLATIYHCDIVHVDDFFLRSDQRTPERLAEPGGNVDYERLYADVLVKIKTGDPFSYRPFNCRTMAFDEPVQIAGKKLTIVEGSYSHHRILADNYDLKIFLTVNADIQLQRILNRNGELMLERFKNEWIPMEKRYAQEFEIPKRSDILVDNLTY